MNSAGALTRSDVKTLTDYLSDSSCFIAEDLRRRVMKDDYTLYELETILPIIGRFSAFMRNRGMTLEGHSQTLGVGYTDSSFVYLAEHQPQLQEGLKLWLDEICA